MNNVPKENAEFRKHTTGNILLLSEIRNKINKSNDVDVETI